MARRIAQFIGGLLLFAILCEAVFRLLPVSTATDGAYRIDAEILNYPPHHVWRTATGWDLRNAQVLRSNNLGFVSDRDYLPAKNAIALIGDSFVEASMLSANDRPGPQLERALHDARPVYSMGGPGSSLLDYAERIRYAHDHLEIRDFVLLIEAGDIRQSICGSGNVHSACLDPATLALRHERQPPAGALKQWLRHSAAAQYLFSQLKIDPQRLSRLLFRSSPSGPSDVLAEPVPGTPAASNASASEVMANVPLPVRRVADVFFTTVAPYVAGGRLIIVVDGARTLAAARGGQLARERAQFMALARAAGATVVDAEPLYQQHAQSSPYSLAVGPYDGHLNSMGVSLTMTAAADQFR
jgi:hypothetical protein